MKSEKHNLKKFKKIQSKLRKKEKIKLFNVHNYRLKKFWEC